MSNLVIVAIPAVDDPVWDYSSEKVPHCTLLFLGNAETMPAEEQIKIVQFLEHAATMLPRFSLDCEHRGTLGPDEADVLFFEGWGLPKLRGFRDNLLKNATIRTAYDSVEQYDTWTPHLTMGYPETPAIQPQRGERGPSWVRFDRIAMWTGNSEGPTFDLKSEYLEDIEVSMSDMRSTENALAHFGVKGMKWGKRKSAPTTLSVASSASSVTKKVVADYNSMGDKQFKRKYAASKSRYAKRVAKNGDPYMNSRGAKTAKALKSKKANAKYEKKVLGNGPSTSSTPKTKGPVGPQLKVSANASSVTKKVVADYNSMTNTEFKRKYAASKARYAKRVAKNGDPYMKGRGMATRKKLQGKKATAKYEKKVVTHSGVKGMKWGQRKSDGSVQVTAKATSGKAKIKTKGGGGDTPHMDALGARVSEQRLKKSGINALSNQELQSLALRLNLERNVKTMAPSSAGQKAAKLVLDTVGSKQVKSLKNQAAAEQLSNLLKKK